MIYNKSTHPVEVKKISIRLWSLRDEIEAAIGRRVKECEAAGVPLYIDDIKEYYNLNPKVSLTEQDNVLQLPTAQGGEGEEGINSLMESLADTSSENTGQEEAPPETPPESAPPEATEAPASAVEGTSPEAVSATEENKAFTEAEEIIADQKRQGLDNNRPNPILQRPYQRQAPDLDKISYGFTLLSDINMEFFLSFIKERFLQGQSVIVEFLIPQSFMMSAEISYCHHYARTSKIISSAKPDYRVQCKFSFKTSGERENLRNFLKSIEPTIPIAQKKPKKESEEDSLGF